MLFNDVRSFEKKILLQITYRADVNISHFEILSHSDIQMHEKNAQTEIMSIWRQKILWFYVEFFILNEREFL